MSTAADALTALHAIGFVHTDIKPRNIVVTPEGRVALLDYGITIPFGAPVARGGTAPYLAPECITCDPLTDRTDVYSLGLVLYECLVGDVPFYVPNDYAATAVARLHRAPTDLRDLDPELPRELTDLVHRCLAIDPAVRPTVHEVRDDLAAWV